MEELAWLRQNPGIHFHDFKYGTKAHALPIPSPISLNRSYCQADNLDQGCKTLQLPRAVVLLAKPLKAGPGSLLIELVCCNKRNNCQNWFLLVEEKASWPQGIWRHLVNLLAGFIYNTDGLLGMPYAGLTHAESTADMDKLGNQI